MKTYRVAVASALLLAILGCGGGGEAGTAPTEIVVPSSYDARNPTPLVVFLHGYLPGRADVVGDYKAWLQLVPAAEARTVLLALPKGTPDVNGTPCWNGAGCCGVGSGSMDHVGRLKAVVAEAKTRFNVDPKKVFFLGHSNGGFMAHRMACEASDTVASIVAIAGDVWKDSALCRPAGHVAVLQVHGDADLVIPYQGSADYPSASGSIGTWATLNGCTGALGDTGTRLDLDTSVTGPETKVEAHSCTATAAELWTMQGSSHAPAFAQPAATERFIDWLLAHPKP